MIPPKLRKSLLFAIVAALPIAALVIQRSQIARYEDELAHVNLNDVLIKEVDEIRQEILAMLEQIKTDVVASNLAGSRPDAARNLPDGVVLIGFEQDGELKWPWELTTGASDPRARDETLLMLQTNYPMNVDTSAWQAFGLRQRYEFWLIGKAQTGPNTLPVVPIVDGGYIVDNLIEAKPSRLGILLGTSEDVSVGDLLFALRVSIPPETQIALAQSKPVPPRIYEVTVLLALSLAILGAYLLWKDARRERAVMELRSQFVSGVSHELKTPLTSIRMFAETMQIADESGVDNAEKRAEYLETIIRESERLTRLLNNVLAFSQIERGLRTYHMQRVSLQAIVADAAQMMRFPLDEQGFEIDLSISDDVPPIEADRDAVQQAVLNLLSNAMKYSGKSRRIELRLFRQGKDAVIAVTDHGIGIPKNEQNRIFDSFYRASGNGSQAIAGTGLGLAIVHHIATAHGGSVNVESKTGKGSTFFIRVPIDRESEA